MRSRSTYSLRKCASCRQACAPSPKCGEAHLKNSIALHAHGTRGSGYYGKTVGRVLKILRKIRKSAVCCKSVRKPFGSDERNKVQLITFGVSGFTKFDVLDARPFMLLHSATKHTGNFDSSRTFLKRNGQGVDKIHAM